jgi:hypothetical protein
MEKDLSHIIYEKLISLSQILACFECWCWKNRLDLRRSAQPQLAASQWYKYASGKYAVSTGDADIIGSPAEIEGIESRESLWRGVFR